PADTSLTTRGFLYEKDTASLALRNNPSIAYINHEIEISKLEKAVETSRALPELKIGYNNQSIIGNQEVNGFQKSFDVGNRFHSIQAGVSIPLWYGSYNAKSKAAKIREKAAQANAETYTGTFQNKYNSLLMQLDKDEKNISYYETQAVPEANLIIEQASRSYKAGEIDYLAYIQSVNNALSIKENYLEALSNYNQTVIAIEQLTGKIN
ncbi:MAG: TolC family protein, partial [Paludibacteraceae bacterium]